MEMNAVLKKVLEPQIKNVPGLQEHIAVDLELQYKSRRNPERNSKMNGSNPSSQGFITNKCPRTPK